MAGDVGEADVASAAAEEEEPGAGAVVVAPRSAAALVRLEKAAASADAYAVASRAGATRVAYTHQWRRFEAWASDHGLASLPASPSTTRMFVAHLADGLGFKPATISQALAAIAKAHELAGVPTPTADPAVREVVRGFRRQKGTAPQRARPLAPPDLRIMSRALPDRLIGTRDRALILLGFASALRRSELVALDVGDLSFDDDGITINIRWSKTDQEGEGERLGVPYGSDRLTCPVRSVLAWIEDAQLESGPLFVGMTKGGALTGKRLTGRDIPRIVKRAAKRAGIDDADISGHSLRAGLVTTAAKAGKPLHSIQRQSRHKSVQVLSGYIRDASLFDDNAASGIGL